MDVIGQISSCGWRRSASRRVRPPGIRSPRARQDDAGGMVAEAAGDLLVRGMLLTYVGSFAIEHPRDRAPRAPRLDNRERRGEEQLALSSEGARGPPHGSKTAGRNMVSPRNDAMRSRDRAARRREGSWWIAAAAMRRVSKAHGTVGRCGSTTRRGDPISRAHHCYTGAWWRSQSGSDFRHITA
jgi:hypothetical protein